MTISGGAPLTRGNGTTTSYAYDTASRLNDLAHDLAGTADDVSWDFAYNPASQIVTAARTETSNAYAWTGHYNVSRGYTANGLNQYTASGPVNPTYDVRGNLTSAGGETYLYTAENMLRSGSGGTSLYYDALGRMSQKTAPLGGETRVHLLLCQHDSSDRWTQAFCAKFSGFPEMG